MASTPSPERGRLKIPSWLLPVVLVVAAVATGVFLLLSYPPPALVTTPPDVAASLSIPTATMPAIPTATPPSAAPSTAPVASSAVTTTTLLLTWEPGKESFNGSCATPLRAVGRSSQAPQFVQLDCDLDNQGDVWVVATQAGVSNDTLVALPDCCRPAPTAAPANPAPSTANYASNSSQGTAQQAPMVYTDLNTLPTAPPEATAAPAAPASTTDSTEGCSLTTGGGRCPAKPIPTALPADQVQDGIPFHWPPLPANSGDGQAQP